MSSRRLLDKIVRKLAIPEDREASAEVLVSSEWLVTNGLGGYASGTVAGVNTRRYHGILVAALPNPLGRTVMLNHLGEQLTLPDGRHLLLSGEERVGGRFDPNLPNRLIEFHLEAGLPVWRYQWGDFTIEKRLLMPYRQNTVHVTYRLLAGDGPVKLEIHPAVHFRGYEEPVSTPRQSPQSARYVLTTIGPLHIIKTDAAQQLPPLLLRVFGAETTFVGNGGLTSEYLYPVEESRGYEFRGSLWAPGHLTCDLAAHPIVTFVASTEPEHVMSVLMPDEAAECELERRRRLVDGATEAVRDEVAAELVLAADQFVFTPTGRVADTTRAAATGDEIRSIIAGYHWFTDWGRDAMISLEGLTLGTGRLREAAYLLRTFAHYVRDGLIPNLFPDGSNQGLYHTADATLWFFHALSRYSQTAGDQTMVVQLLPTLLDIVEHHVRGTRFGICVDPADGLLREGAPGYQLTWMDAKVGDWVVTPRRGKAVEINALWYNALCILARWVSQERAASQAQPLLERAAQVRESFNRRFWIADRGYLYDVIDGEQGDAAECRPNQIFAISLEHPVLEDSRWQSVMQVVEQRLLTPVGLRSLAPGEPEYKPRYYGDRRARDAAYHQGTVWAWLIGPYIDAWLKLNPGQMSRARALLSGCLGALDSFGLGTIGEIFDAEPPYTPRGCIAQAWSVAEVLRCWAKTTGTDSPGHEAIVHDAAE